MAAIAVLTDELIRFSNPAADALVRNALAEAVIARLDTDFISPSKAEVANVSPASITNGITAVRLPETRMTTRLRHLACLLRPTFSRTVLSG